MSTADTFDLPDASAHVSVLCWNLWFAGLNMDHGQAKQIDFLREQAADVVFLQECVQVGSAVIAETLGYGIAQQGFDTAVLSRYPVTLLPTATTPYATAARVDLPGGPALVWSVHLEHTDYGPYRAAELPQAAADVSAQPGEVLRDEQAAAVLAETTRLLEQLPTGTPTIIAGDFNVPSPTDWDGRFRPRMQWPATSRVLDAGFVDAFRVIHPEPSTAPGLTWSHIHTLEDEPRDRIDFVFVSGWQVDDCWHTGQALEAEGEGFRSTGGEAHYIPGHRRNDFASDHLAVSARLRR